MIGKELITKGIKIRRDIERGYYAIWFNGKTWRLDLGTPEKELRPGRAEFYDIGLGTRCNLRCTFCYTQAEFSGIDYPSPPETWRKWMSQFPEDTPGPEAGDEVWGDILVTSPTDNAMAELKATLKIFHEQYKLPVVYTEKPFQVAIGSTGEPTLHPEFIQFLQAVAETGVVPNYTTNGLTLADPDTATPLLEATAEYCAGVAVSWGNQGARLQARRAVENLLLRGRCKVMLHHIISDTGSVDDFIQTALEYGPDIHYHVLLPLMKHGRSEAEMEPGVFEYLAARVRENDLLGKIALGANFAQSLKSHPGLLPVWEYPSETYSKNIILKGDGELLITPSSFNTETICERVILS